MVSTIEEAKRYGFEIRREVRFYAVGPNNEYFALHHDWTLEELDRKLLQNETSPDVKKAKP